MTPEETSDLIIQAFRQAKAGEHGAALALYSRILADQPTYGTAHYYAGQLLLANGNFADGWQACEWRPITHMPDTIARWQGEDLRNIPGDPVLLVAGEQGLGDMIQFIRYAPLLRQRVPKMVVGSLAGLKELLLSVPGVDAVVEEGEPLPRITHYVPILSLPYLFKTDLASIPATIPYMQPGQAKIDEWSRKLAWSDLPRVGLVWAGNPDFMGDHRRSPGFEPFRHLLNVSGLHFFSLQKGQASLGEMGCPLPCNLFDLAPDLHSMEDTAAAMLHLDLVISSCTSPAHLAGAVGRPLWLVLSSFPDWRWMRQREDSPWYPSARLFRQAPGEDWDRVLQRVASTLAQART